MIRFGPTLKNTFADDGFSTFDVLVALTVISLISATVAPSVIRVAEKARIERTISDIRNIVHGLNLYSAVHGSFPTQDEGLKAITVGNGPTGSGDISRVFDKLPLDPWGRQYHYAFPGVHGKFDVFSLGADGRIGGNGQDSDVGSWSIF